jgi:hypothetical protein
MFYKAYFAVLYIKYLTSGPFGVTQINLLVSFSYIDLPKFFIHRFTKVFHTKIYQRWLSWPKPIFEGPHLWVIKIFSTTLSVKVKEKRGITPKILLQNHVPCLTTAPCQDMLSIPSFMLIALKCWNNELQESFCMTMTKTLLYHKSF